MEPVRPDYTGPCTSNVVRALRGRETWIPEPVRGARSVVLLVIDGLGWELLEAHREAVPTITSLDGGPIPTVVPSTTTAALTSITTGLSPAEHGIVGYRMYVNGAVMNVLRWSTPAPGKPPEPDELQPRLAFNGEAVPAVTRAEFSSTGFTNVHLRGARFIGWHGASSIAVHCRRLIAEGERFVYAYYGYADIVFHMHGLRDDFLVAEMSFVDRLVGDALEAIPGDCALVVTADHGHIELDEWIELSDVAPMIATQSGEARFRYLHAAPGAAGALLAAISERYSTRAWVLSREQLLDEGWLGPNPTAEVRRRLGDVVIAARDPVGFADPVNPGETRLRSAHGSLTPSEMLVPLLASRGVRGA